MVSTRWSDDILASLEEKKAAGAILAGLENNISDKRLVRLSKASEALKRVSEGRIGGGSRGETGVNLADSRDDPAEVILVLGEEVNGIPTEVLEKLDILFEIPMKGKKESFNVSVVAGIALYELNR